MSTSPAKRRSPGSSRPSVPSPFRLTPHQDKCLAAAGGPPARWSVLVIWANGEQEYVKEGPTVGKGRVALFTEAGARLQRDFLLMGMDEGEVQSVNVVPAPAEGAA